MIQAQTYNPRKERYKIIIANWYNALKQIKDRNGRVGRMSEFMRARNQAPFEDDVWQCGAYASTTLDYAKDNHVLLVKEGPELLQLENAERAVQLHRDNKEYPITQDTYNSHLKQAEKESKTKKAPEKRSILILPERENFTISSENHFDVLRFLAEDPNQAEKYLRRLSEKDINKITFYLRNKNYVDKQEVPFQDQLWLHSLDSGSGLFGYGRYLNYDYVRVFGVFKKTGEASSQKIEGSKQKLPYSSKEAIEMYKLVEKIRKGDIRISDLESKLSQVSDFLENLSK